MSFLLWLIIAVCFNLLLLVWRCFSTLFKICFYLALLSFLAVFILRLFDEPSYRMLKLKASLLAGEMSSHLPKNVVSLYTNSMKLLTLYGRIVWQRLADFGERLIVAGSNGYRWFSTDETVQMYTDSLWHFFHALYVQTMDISLSLYGKFKDWIET